MATKNDFSAEEWGSLLRAPMDVAMLIILASPSGPVGAFKEMMSATKEMVKSSQKILSSDLMRSLGAEFADKDKLKQAQPDKDSLRDMPKFRQDAIDNVTQVVALLDEKASPEEATEVKGWLFDIAQKTASASKEGGFLGFGGVRVDEAEAAALKDLATLLDVEPAA
jgi:hypothetical protein